MKYSIKDFYKGKATSPFVGDGAFANSSSLDVLSQPGMAKIGLLPVSGSQTALTGFPIDFAQNTNDSASLYFAGDDENVYRLTVATMAISKLDSSRGNNCAVFNNDNVANLYSVYRKKLYKYTIATTTWSEIGTNAVTSLDVKDNHAMFVSRNDGRLYIAGTFTSGTFGIGMLDSADSFTQKAFVIPAEFKPIAINELGLYLVISAKKLNSTSESNIEETTYFFWDRTASTADNIISIPESNMHNFINTGSALYVTGGKNGSVYKLSESGFSYYAQIPFDYDTKKVLIGNTTTTQGGNSFDSACWWKNKLMVGVSSLEGLYPAGIYALKGGSTVHEYLPSHGDDASTNDVYIGCMTTGVDANLYFGWKRVVGETTTYGVDKVSATNYRVPSTTYVESLFYKLSDKFVGEKAIQRIEVRLSKPLATGHAVTIKYRKGIEDSWTTLGTKTYATDGALASLVFTSILNVENVQIRVELTTGASSTTTPEILEINLF